MVLAIVLTAADGQASETTQGWGGMLGSASWNWQLPDTPNGLKPTQSWHATGSAPNGDIYIGGMDHATNSALYRLEPRTGVLRYVGDARSASERAKNWLPGETAQKFHTRPLWYHGKAYVATLDRSSLNDEYLSRRGFHWYAYDPRDESFVDLSAREPSGASAEHGGLVTLAADLGRNAIYGASVPTGDIYRYDLDTGRTTKLGRPSAYDKPYVYAGRVMWVDSRGRLYFTAGNPFYIWGTYDPTIYAHVFYYDPAHGFGEKKDWALQEPRALELGQCTTDRKRCFFADDQGHIYRFDDDGPSWSYIGKVETPPIQLWIWLFQVSADGKKAYVATSSWESAANPAWLYEFDLTTGRTRRLCSFAQLDPKVAEFNLHTGYDAWDQQGRFYFANFATDSDRNIIVTRLDPVRLKAELGLLTAVTEVNVTRDLDEAAPFRFIFTRSGNASSAQEVIYRVAATDPHGIAQEHYGTITIPEGATSVPVSLAELQKASALPATSGSVAVVPNGDDYVVGASGSVSF